MVIEMLSFKVNNLSNPLGTGDLLLLACVAYPFTVVVMLDVINPLNMPDGAARLLAG